MAADSAGSGWAADPTDHAGAGSAADAAGSGWAADSTDHAGRLGRGFHRSRRGPGRPRIPRVQVGPRMPRIRLAADSTDHAGGRVGRGCRGFGLGRGFHGSRGAGSVADSAGSSTKRIRPRISRTARMGFGRGLLGKPRTSIPFEPRDPQPAPFEHCRIPRGGIRARARSSGSGRPRVRMRADS